MIKTPRPLTPIEDFEKALNSASLSARELELIDYIRYIGVFSQPMMVKDLKLKPKPPALSQICEICRKIGGEMPEHFEKIRKWSKQVSEYGVKWDGDLICSSAKNIDGDYLSPSSGTSPYEFLVVHKELFIGLS
ncbi:MULTISPECIES: hypothetical protein [Prochlorococcus]|uniref:hypothetical protein n=1 Tax=Prochlorococcus TaxID=1218 RepID=UPI000533A5D5|nr:MULTISPECIES: hypothetical protein [Prochlorococcus]KGG13019.1 hypothetical protein EV05_0693 [Prochlorococcus sp. MIT 0601]